MGFLFPRRWVPPEWRSSAVSPPGNHHLRLSGQKGETGGPLIPTRGFAPVEKRPSTPEGATPKHKTSHPPHPFFVLVFLGHRESFFQRKRAGMTTPHVVLPSTVTRPRHAWRHMTSSRVAVAPPSGPLALPGRHSCVLEDQSKLFEVALQAESHFPPPGREVPSTRNRICVSLAFFVCLVPTVAGSK